MEGPKAGYMREIYLQKVMAGSVPQTTDYTKLKLEAQSKISPEAFGYADGSASTEKTARTNTEAFDRWHIVPRMLADTDVADADLRTELFGQVYQTPFVVCPIGVQGLYHKEADVATARAAVELGVPYTHSTAASTSLDEVAEKAELNNPDNTGWYQLYWPSDDKLTASLVLRAKKSGYKVLVVTLDTFVLGWRPRDLDTGFNPFLKGMGVANVFTDPYFIETYCEGKDPRRSDATPEEILQASVAAVNLINPGTSRKWSDLAALRALWGDSPIVLKGILSPADATRAIEAGMDGIWVSNHGGRQVDGSISSLQALEVIGRYVRNLPMYVTPGLSVSRSNSSKPDDSITTSANDPDRAACRRRRPYVIFDSGIRCGADAMKALALGADAVAIGRPWLWGLSANGQDGVKSVFRAFAADLELNMTLSGVQGISQLNPTLLVEAWGAPRL